MNRYITIEVSVPDCKEVQKALNYLATWGLVSYDRVIICDDFPCRENGNIMAYYKNSISECSYTIGAIWDKDSRVYSFHT